MNTLHECDMIGARHDPVMDRSITNVGAGLGLAIVA